MSRTIRFTCTAKDTWYKVFDESAYKKNRILEITVKFDEAATADHFRYNHDGDTTNYKTSSVGATVPRNAKTIYVYVPDTAAQVINIEIIYK